MAHKRGSQWSKTVAITEKTDILANELAVALSDDNILQKCGSDSAVTERKKMAEAAKQRYFSMLEESDRLNDQVESARKLLNNTNDEYLSLVENIKSLKETILVEDENIRTCRKLGDDTRTKLKLYKALTGVYFDFNTENKDLTGFVAVEGYKHQNPALVPFEFAKNDSDASKVFLWNKIGEALQDIM